MGAWELQHPLPVGGLVEAADAAGTWWTVTVVDVIGDREYRTEVDDGPGTVWESVGAENMRLPSSAEKELEGLQADLDAAERRKDEARCVEIEEKMATAQRGGVRTLRKGDAVDVKNRLDGEWRPGTVHAVGPPPSVDIGHGIASFAHVRLSQDSLAHPLSVGDACEALDAEGTWWPVSVRRVLSGTSYAVTVDDGARTEWPEVLAQNMRRARAKKIGKELTKEKEGGGRRSRGDRDKDKDGGGRRRKDGHRRRRASSSGSSAASSSGGASSSSGRRGGGGGAASPASSSRRLKASSKKDKKEKKKKGSSSRGGKDGDKRDRKDKKRARRSDNRSSEDEEGGAAGAARSSSHPHQHHHHHHHRGATASLVKGDVVSWWASDVQRLRRGVVVSSKTCRLEGGETVGIPPEAARVDAGFLPVPLTAVSAVRRAAAVEAALDGADGLRLTRDGAGHGAKPALAVLSLALPPDAPDTRFTFHLETACRLRKCDPPASANEPGPLTIGLVRADVAAAAGGRGSGASGHHHSGRGVLLPHHAEEGRGLVRGRRSHRDRRRPLRCRRHPAPDDGPCGAVAAGQPQRRDGDVGVRRRPALPGAAAPGRPSPSLPRPLARTLAAAAQRDAGLRQRLPPGRPGHRARPVARERRRRRRRSRRRRRRRRRRAWRAQRRGKRRRRWRRRRR
eukprot:Rhum_TRINITY_DN14076_c1_g1::Rhum_TRINITY_DN14076_c1_g1_i1::g.68523::m.68523